MLLLHAPALRELVQKLTALGLEEDAFSLVSIVAFVDEYKQMLADVRKYDEKLACNHDFTSEGGWMPTSVETCSKCGWVHVY